MTSQPSHKETVLGTEKMISSPRAGMLRKKKKEFLSLDAFEILISEIVILFCKIIQHM